MGLDDLLTKANILAWQWIGNCHTIAQYIHLTVSLSVVPISLCVLVPACVYVCARM